jgi:hypothetical protein
MLHHSRSVSSRMGQTKEAYVNYSPTVYTIGRISCWRLTQQRKQLPIILRRRTNGKEYVTSAENDTIEVSNETEIRLKGFRKTTY